MVRTGCIRVDIALRGARGPAMATSAPTLWYVQAVLAYPCSLVLIHLLCLWKTKPANSLVAGVAEGRKRSSSPAAAEDTSVAADLLNLSHPAPGAVPVRLGVLRQPQSRNTRSEPSGALRLSCGWLASQGQAWHGTARALRGSSLCGGLPTAAGGQHFPAGRSGRHPKLLRNIVLRPGG